MVPARAGAGPAGPALRSLLVHPSVVGGVGIGLAGLRLVPIHIDVARDGDNDEVVAGSAEVQFGKVGALGRRGRLGLRAGRHPCQDRHKPQGQGRRRNQVSSHSPTAPPRVDSMLTLGEETPLLGRGRRFGGKRRRGAASGREDEGGQDQDGDGAADEYPEIHPAAAADRDAGQCEARQHRRKMMPMETRAMAASNTNSSPRSGGAEENGGEGARDRIARRRDTVQRHFRGAFRAPGSLPNNPVRLFLPRCRLA